MTTAFEVTDALRSMGYRGRWANGKGHVCCPVHNDRNPSLLISDGRNGELMVHCLAGCDWRDVKARLKDLGVWQDEPRSVREKPRNQSWDFGASRRQRRYGVLSAT